MTAMFIIFFWISLGILFYCYLGYGILAMILVGLKRIFVRKGKRKETGEWPPVTLIVTAYNEEKILQQKIQNTMAIDYPADKLQLLFVTDGSQDDSVSLIRQYNSIQLLHQPERRGKYAAIKRAMR